MDAKDFVNNEYKNMNENGNTTDLMYKYYQNPYNEYDSMYNEESGTHSQKRYNISNEFYKIHKYVIQGMSVGLC